MIETACEFRTVSALEKTAITYKNVNRYTRDSICKNTSSVNVRVNKKFESDIFFQSLVTLESPRCPDCSTLL